MLFQNVSYAQSGGGVRPEKPGENPFGEISRRHIPGHGDVPSSIILKEGTAIPVDSFVQILLRDKPFHKLKAKKKEVDELDFTHIRYQQYYKDVEVEGGEYIIHSKKGRVKSANGKLKDFDNFDVAPAFTEEAAFNEALSVIGAKRYKWEVKEEEQLLKWATGDDKATYYPKGELVITSLGEQEESLQILAYRFDIYAEEPHSRKMIYIDAQTGKVINSLDLLCHIDSEGIAHTRYSGEQKITTDNFSEGFRLRQSSRGKGVVTLNMHNSESYSEATDYVNVSNTWNGGIPENAAYDAHWGAEGTYDYFLQRHNRNSFDNEGTMLISFVSYSEKYNNAFWNGRWMTYGDGDGVNLSPLTSLDIVAHEISHGVTNYSANLIYLNESGALNESFSDIFATATEFYKGVDANFLIGEKIFIKGGFLRDMSNPKRRRHPNTYGGENWYTGSDDNGGVHINSGVQNYWFYLLCTGGSGINDLGNEYHVNPIGLSKAAAVAYRNLTVYLSRFSDYQDARNFSIQSAEDLFGECSDEVKAVTNAWHAVGVGEPYTEKLTSDFSALSTSACKVPITVYFENKSINGEHYVWSFGDGNTSSEENPVHMYTKAGTYDVKLTTEGNVCGIGLKDSIRHNNFVVINTPDSPSVQNGGRCGSGKVNLSVSGEGMFKWYDAPQGGNYLYTGTDFITPEISETTKYYVEREIKSATVFSEPIDHRFGTGGYHNNSSTQFLVFDCLKPFTLKSVWVNSGASGSRTINLWDEEGHLVKSVSVNIPAGTSRIQLNLGLEPGRNYKLGGAQMNLYRNDTGPSYPYFIEDVVRVHNSSAGPSYYYYFYHWEIVPEPCLSSRSEIIAYVSEMQDLEITGTSEVQKEEKEVLFKISPEENTRYLWSAPEDCRIVTGQNTPEVNIVWGSYSGFVHVESQHLGCSSYDSLLVNIAGSLPVSLLNFNVGQIENKVRLDWSTANQKNACCFVVEKSTNSLDFDSIGTVKAAGESSGILTYSFNDVLPEFQPLRNQSLYYRLKIMNNNGVYEYSPVRNIQPESIGFKAFAYPNPVLAGENLTIKFDKVSDSPILCQVVDLSGKIIRTLEIPDDTGEGFNFSTYGMNRGIYIFRFINIGSLEIKKVVVQ